MQSVQKDSFSKQQQRLCCSLQFCVFSMRSPSHCRRHSMIKAYRCRPKRVRLGQPIPDHCAISSKDLYNSYILFYEQSRKWDPIFLPTRLISAKANCVCPFTAKAFVIRFEDDDRRHAAKTLCLNLRQEETTGNRNTAYKHLRKPWKLSSFLVDWYVQSLTVCAFLRQKRSGFDPKMIVEVIRPNLCVQICKKKKATANPYTPTKHIRKPWKSSLFSLDWYELVRTKANCVCPFTSTAVVIRFEDDGRRNTAKYWCRNWRQEETTCELKHGNQTPTKTFEIISLPTRLSSNSTDTYKGEQAVPLHGKSVRNSIRRWW